MALSLLVLPHALSLDVYCGFCKSLDASPLARPLFVFFSVFRRPAHEVSFALFVHEQRGGCLPPRQPWCRHSMQPQQLCTCGCIRLQRRELADVICIGASCYARRMLVLTSENLRMSCIGCGPRIGSARCLRRMSSGCASYMRLCPLQDTGVSSLPCLHGAPAGT